MLNSFENLFYEPIKELDNFQLIKENTSFQDFIMIYEQVSDTEEKIKILKSLNSIFNHKYSQINLSTICSSNNNNTLEIKNDMEIDNDLKIDKLNISDYTNINNEYIRWITNEYFSANNETIKQYLSDILILIINVKGVNKYDISKVYEEFSKIYFYSQQQIDINEFLKNIKFLSLFYGFKESNTNENINYIQSKINNKPYNYYFFQGNESIKISPSITSNEKSKLKDGLSIYICFNCLLNPKYNKKASNKSTIFSIHFQNYNKFTLFIDDKMNLCLNLYDDKNKKDSIDIIDKIENNKWYNVGINLNTIKKNKKFPVTILINNVVNNNIKDIECQNIKINEINNITVCEDFTGFITNILLFNKFIDMEELNFYRIKYKYGLYKFKHVSKFIDKLNEDLLKHLIVLLIPMENNNEDKIINNLANDYTNDNIVNNFNIKFNSKYLVNNNVNINYHFDNKINLLGGIENILPLCEILIKISKDLSSKDLNIFQQCIHIIIKIINTILINHKTNTGQLADTKFLEIFSLFLQSINVTPNNKTKMELLNENIMYSLNDLTAHLINNSNKYPKQCKSYLNNLILNIKIIGKFSLQNQNMIFDFVAKHINSVNAENLIDHENLLYLIEYYNEYYKQYFCCQEHQKFYGDKKKVMDLKTPFDLLTKIIGFSIKYDEDTYIRILHLLVIKSQPCLIKFIIKNIFILNLTKTDTKKNEKNKFIKFLVKNNLLYILLFLLSTYVYPDIICDIINIFSILSVQSNPTDNSNFFTRDNIINYIAESILPIYVRIKKKDINIIEEEPKLALKPKFLAASEIVFSRSNDNNDLDDNDNEKDNGLNEEDNLEDEYLGVNTYENKFRLSNSEKMKINYRKKSDDNYYQNHKFNLNNIHEFDLNDNYQTNSTKKKSYDDNDNSESEEKNKTPVLKSPKKIKSLIQNIKKLSSISDKKLKIYYNNKPNIETLYEKKKEEYNKLTPVLEKINKKQMSSFIQTILDSLLNWLKFDFKIYVMKIIYIFFKINKIEYLHIYKFIETVNVIINEKISSKNNNLSIKLFSIDFYFWYIDIMFQFYLKKNNRDDLITIDNSIIFSNEDKDLKNVIDIILEKGLKILVNFIINIKFETKEIIKLFDDLLLCGTKIKKYYSLNKNTISYLNSFYLELFISILKEYHKYHSQNNSEEIVPMINICYEYMIFFNNENKSEEINNFLINDNQIFNGIILSGINTNNINSSNNEISKFWTDYGLFENIMNILKQTINIESINYKDDNYLEENILSHKKSDTFLEHLLFLCNLKNGSTNNSSNNNIIEDVKNEQLPLLYIISNLYAITVNLSNNKEEKEKILKNYKLYIIFLILSSSNLSYNPSLTNIIQSKVELIIIYFIGFLIERYNNGLDKDISISILNDIFILMIKVLKRANDQIQNKKNNKIFTKIISIATTQKKIDFSKCAVFRIFSKDSMANVFNKDFVKTIRKNNFKFFDDKTYLIQLLLSCLDLKLIQKDVKNIFCADKFIQKGHERVREINELKYKESLIKEEKINCYDLNFFKTRKKISNIIDNSLFALEEEIKIFKEYQYLDKLKIKNNYKKAKKNLFSFCGLWSNKDIFYKNNSKEEGDDEENEENKSNDNSLDEVLKEKEKQNIYKNKYILKYKLINHYGKSPFRPILSPIYDINSYLPCFSQFNKDNLFIEKKEGQSITTAINLNMAEIFNDENNSYSFLNSAGNEETDSILSNIYQINFIDAYNHYINKLLPIYTTERLSSSPLSGIVSNSHQCCYVTQMSHIKGYLYLNKSYCSFVQNIYNGNNEDDEKKLKEDEDYDDEKKMCYGSYIKLNKSKYISMDVKYKSIQYIFLRKYYYKDSAVEIFTSKNKVYYFNFQDSFKRQCFLNLLLNKFSTKKEIKIMKNKLIGYEISSSNTNNNKNNSSDFLTNLTENWQDWKISTMDLILWLNVLSNRSFNDISQYPVFPWILIQYEDNFSSEKKISLSKSFMPKFKSNKFKNITTNLIKSNSDDIKANKINFKKNKEKQIDNAIDEKNEIEEVIVNSEDNNNIIEEDEKNKYDPFPIKDKESQIILDKDIRNFALPMGMMSLNEEGEKRKSNYILKYSMMKKEIEANEKENKNNKNNNANYINTKIYIYGSHYSNPLYVCHYLTRIFPFSNISIELQGDKFDDPNRLLISVNKSFEASASHEGDVRELCPEFFYLPEIFMNHNNLDLKIKSKNSKENSNDVILPKWADNDNYIFITKLKTYLESEEVNKKINKWFDLIFGYKQKGKEAENAYNLFIPSSYDTFDLKNEDPDQKQYFLRLIEFGLTPHQIFNKKFLKRKQKNNKNKMISESCREIELKINEFERKDNKNELKVLKLKFIDNENIFVVLNNFQFIKYEISNYHELNSENKTIRFDSKQNPPNNYIKSEKIPKLNYLRNQNNKILNKSYPVIIYDKGSYIATGGYYDGKIIVSQLNNKNSKSKSKSLILNTFEVINPMDNSQVNNLIINKSENFILSGSIQGTIVIYNNKKNLWKKKSQINDHLNMPITSLFFNDNLNIWGSAACDGYVNLYTFPTNRKICSIKVESEGLFADFLFIISSPLPSFTIHCKNNFCFYSYSLIGKPICKEYEMDSEIYSPLIIEESNFGEILIYGDNKGKINMRYLPSLCLFFDKGISKNMDYFNVDNLEVSENGKYCIAWNNDNDAFYVIYDNSNMSETEELMILHLANDFDD